MNHRGAYHVRQGTAAGLLDLPKELVANVVSHLPYAALPSFRTTCKLARELVDACSNGWVMKVEECESLLTSGLLQRLTSLVYVWFERWTWEADHEASFLAVILLNVRVFGRLQEIRFPGTASIPLRCLCGLAATLTAVASLSLPPLPPAVPPDSPQQKVALLSVAGLTTLVDLSLDGWAITDVGARTLGQGLQRLQRLVLGNTGAMTRTGYVSLAGLTSLVSLTLSGATGDNLQLAPLAALTGLTGVRVELAPSFMDSDPGPLANMPALRSLGWWHAHTQPAAGLRPGSVAPWLRELSLCFELDMRALTVLASCKGLTMMQVNDIRIPTASEEPGLAAAVAGSVGGSGFGLPVLPTVRTLIVNELSMPPPGEPQPVSSLSVLFPALENVLAFQVMGRGLMQLQRADRLRRLVLNCASMQDEALEFMPPLPSLAALQLEACGQLTDAAATALRATPGLEQLLLLDTAGISDAFLREVAGLLKRLRTLVLSRLANVHDDGLQSLVALADSLEHLELRCMSALTPAGLQVVLQLPRVNLLAVSECAGVGKDACRQLGAALAAVGRDVAVDYEATVLLPVSLADEFGEPAGALDERGSRGPDGVVGPGGGAERTGARGGALG